MSKPYNKQEAQVELDMLHGNLNRMFVTDDEWELAVMVAHAKKRIDKIQEMQYQRLDEKEVK